MEQPTQIRAVRGWRWRDREWAWFATALAVASVAVAAGPRLDLWLSGLFFAADEGFFVAASPLVQAVHSVVPWLGRLAVLLGLLALVLHWRAVRWPSLRWRRRLAMLGLAMLFGVGVAVNGVLKESWGRARPVAVEAFGGPAKFVPALRPSQECRRNCSFVSGHAATGFALGSIGLLGAPATRRRWLLVGAAAGLCLGGLRVAQGGHFASDVVFSGIVIWGCGLVLRALWLRGAARRRARRREFRVASRVAAT